MIFSADTELKKDSAEFNSWNVSSYLMILSGTIDGLISEGAINAGIANSLKVKIENAVKSLNKGNLNSFNLQLNAFMNEVEAFIKNGFLTPESGETLIRKAENAIIAIEGSFTDPRDGYSYPVVLIGEQLWMAENLRAIQYTDGTEIPEVIMPADWAALTTGAYCWFGNSYDRFGSTYGAMYNWYAVKTENLCPAGWHVPSNDEWYGLTDYLIINGYGYRGYGDEIAKAMAATSGWAISAIEGSTGNEQGSNNSSGFTALPGGQRGNTGGFFNPLLVGNWWSSTVMIPDMASWGRNITFSSLTMRASGYANKMGMYVRCVR